VHNPIAQKAKRDAREAEWKRLYEARRRAEDRVRLQRECEQRCHKVLSDLRDREVIPTLDSLLEDIEAGILILRVELADTQ
jgi:hypothetical protein